MKIIIPAAGYATRLYPLTENLPKALLKIGDKKMLEHILHRLESISEIDQVVIVTNSKFYRNFMEWDNGFDYSKEIKILDNGTTSNEERLGVIGDINFAIQNTKIDDDCLIIAGDNIFEFDIEHMINFFRTNNGSGIAVKDLLDKSLLANKFGVVETNDDFRIIGFEEKPADPKTSLTATMVYYITKDHIQEINNALIAGRSDNGGDFIRFLSEKAPVFSYVFDEPWYDIGSHEELKTVNELYRRKE